MKARYPEIGIAEIVDYEPTQEIENQIALFEEEAEKDIASKRQTANVHFRWSEFEIKRAKKNCRKTWYAVSNVPKIDIKTSHGR